SSPAPPSPVVVVDNSCGNGCPHPYVCQEGECRVTDSYVEGLEREGNSRIKGGIGTMAAGGALTALGLIVGGVAIGQKNRADQRWLELVDNPDCSISPECAAERDDMSKKSDTWGTVTWAF